MEGKEKKDSEVLALPGGMQAQWAALEQAGLEEEGEARCGGRKMLSGPVCECLQTLVVGCVLAVAIALPCPALEAHVRQVRY